MACAALVKIAHALSEYYSLVGDDHAAVQTDANEQLAKASALTAPQVVEKRDPKSGVDLNYCIVFEVCGNCKTHNVHTRHNEQKYQDFAARLGSKVSEAAG